MQRDKEVLKLETEIPETIQSELRKKDTKKMNRACGIRTKIEHLCHQSPRRRGENVQCWKNIEEIMLGNSQVW